MLELNTVKSSADQRYFQTLGAEPGLNRIRANPLTLIDFGVLRLAAGEEWQASSGDDEILAVLLGGRGTIAAAGETYRDIGERASVFGGRPYAVFIPPGHTYSIEAARGPLEVGLCMARKRDDLPIGEPFLLTPAEIRSGVLGAANFARDYHSVLQETDRLVHRLEVGETYTHSGNWSTFPPHRHEIDPGGTPRRLEEICYYRIDPPEGFGLLKHYTPDGELDTVYTARDNTVLLVDRGYHPWVSAPGYCGYHLWFHGGEARGLQASIDPTLAWVGKAAPMLRQHGRG